MVRPLLVTLLVALGLVLLAGMASAAVQWYKEARLDGSTIALVAVSLISFLFLLSIAVREPQPNSVRGRCFNCGSRLFLTVRSLDRREVLTCFGCGSELALPVANLESAIGLEPRIPLPHE